MIRLIALYFVLFFALPLVALATEGDTPLHDAAKNNDYNLAASLIAEGADVNAENEDGNTPLYYARPLHKSATDSSKTGKILFI